MTSYEMLKSVTSAYNLGKTADHLHELLVDMSDYYNTVEELDTQLVSEQVQQCVSEILDICAHMGISYKAIVCNSVNELGSENPEFYEELLAKNIL